MREDRYIETDALILGLSKSIIYATDYILRANLYTTVLIYDKSELDEFIDIEPSKNIYTTIIDDFKFIGNDILEVSIKESSYLFKSRAIVIGNELYLNKFNISLNDINLSYQYMIKDYREAHLFIPLDLVIPELSDRYSKLIGLELGRGVIEYLYSKMLATYRLYKTEDLKVYPNEICIGRRILVGYLNPHGYNYLKICNLEYNLSRYGIIWIYLKDIGGCEVTNKCISYQLK